MAAVLESFSALASPPSVIADTIARAATASGRGPVTWPGEVPGW